MEKTWDVIIVGAGPAGLTAGIYAARQGHTTLILDGGKVGGRALEAHRIDNFPGFPKGVTGEELMHLFHDQAARFGAEFRRETVIGLNDIGEAKMVSTRGGFHQARTVIIATGVQRKQLSIPGEEEYKGRGVSYCATCDGPFFKGKTVAVVGSGHEAAADALALAQVASKVYTIPGPKGYTEIYPELENLHASPKVETLEGCEVEEIRGTDMVTKIRLKGGKASEIPVDGVFVLLEHVATTGMLADAGVTVNETGCVVVDREQRTNLPGIYAAGDCSCHGYQVVTSAGDGARAALSAMKHIREAR
jgi:thioredoxin reductase (NADPH)